MRRFVCRICGEPGERAFEESHACMDCWETWQRRLDDDFPASLARQDPAAPPMDGQAPPAPTSPGQLAETGGHWCWHCQRFVTPIISDQGLPMRCSRCEGYRLKFHPPVPGYRREVVA